MLGEYYEMRIAGTYARCREAGMDDQAAYNATREAWPGHSSVDAGAVASKQRAAWLKSRGNTLDYYGEILAGPDRAIE